MDGGRQLIEELRRICGDEHVVTEHHALRTYESDGLLQYAAVPRAAVLPGTGEEVAAVVRACHAAGVPWVARGSGSGLSGGALPLEDGVLVVLSRLRRILEVDLENQRVVCEPGVTNVAITAAVGPSHFYPPDPSSQIVCSIGGNVAENSGGAHCFKYGFTTNYVCGLEVVLPDGTVMELGGKELDLPGYDLCGVFVGSEGTLGVATKIIVRVVPTPESVRTLVAFFESPGHAGHAVSNIVSAGVVPGAIEMMDNLTIGASEAMAHAGWPLDAGAALLVELDGPQAELEATLRPGRRSCARRPAAARCAWRATRPSARSSGRCARPPSRPWAASPRTTTCRTRSSRARRWATCSTASTSSRASTTSRWPTSSTPATAICTRSSATTATPRARRERAEELAGEIVIACVEAGGSITGEHGVGVDKKRYMPKMFSEADLDAFQKLRCAFDPDGLANPGKVMPTPRLCGEVPGPYREHPLEKAGLAERF